MKRNICQVCRKKIYWLRPGYCSERFGWIHHRCLHAADQRDVSN